MITKGCGLGEQEWIPADVDTTRPSAARVYDVLLGGGHNFESDRRFAREAERIFPGITTSSRINREFLRRAVLHALESGVRQFLDLGSGIPTVGNVHEIVHEIDPSCPVVYVDCEPVAVAHSRLLLDDDAQATIVQADARRPDTILGHPDTRRLLDFDQPVMLLILALVHFIPDDDHPAELVERYRRALAPGSMLAVSHAADEARPEELAQLTALFATSTNPATPRPSRWIADLFGDFEMVEPGAVFVSEWRPDEHLGEDASDYLIYGGVGVRR
ncbi:SAM-dependent methyltransferase [Saccharopolyspora sp. NFXS83]|uniref:SAM-dependent methyltransferase n=1 Tax=Saccharopolyspora sp. NFXS83 TaxID=2993560 RepID=UPI00224B0D51|nr:SAM-dependent methyltransferase [Saccharopolyspora sp. NFXS83]MCX2733056.1 SAM-dependent methyltransferase [Saccharopolyspora sp. NFXS83]